MMTVLTKAPESQFAYVVLAARRARQIMAGAPPLLEKPRKLKATRIACGELENGLIEYDFVEPPSIDEDKKGNKRRKKGERARGSNRLFSATSVPSLCPLC